MFDAGNKLTVANKCGTNHFHSRVSFLPESHCTTRRGIFAPSRNWRIGTGTRCRTYNVHQCHTPHSLGLL